MSTKNNCFQAQERNEARSRHVVADTNCKYSFSPNGQCYIEYEGPKRPGVTTGKLILVRLPQQDFIALNIVSGSCLPLAFGGECFNVPPECKTCQDIEIGDAIINLARKKKKFLAKFLGVKFL